ncbi:preprotein translocase subunit SecG [Snodgrassella alvi]|jgi:preprotein translocase subunit SecG|uniref:Protein-export membrane protein SecG n=1 Tax=Snodgrassella alvi TaxID=1196083 RepID=A0A855FT40_9NEIS|nr:preprotein translocase subunit SecG [Snodgrassella alvi]PIT13577.1 preprotein translocase subunit SecG [Snodgrassella alvi]PIT28822.1 preprotein translocase subunit SecG [Snodgrassella alvi]PIT46064.1 preprotein translocase subunit SecG [Snodgrassella alvi]PIT56231.1 preprotein translocase subunit SecG [Snodgrassella alvi]PIT58928.1 preprotein translocase subunit SecG [Snodgrassella alvi]
MEAFKTLILIVNIFAALSVIVLVLMQQGKGADAGAAFGSGSAQGVFGAAGNANFLSRSTAIAATIFFITCLALGYISTHRHTGLDFSDVKQQQVVVPAAASAPAVPVKPAQKPLIPE